MRGLIRNCVMALVAVLGVSTANATVSYTINTTGSSALGCSSSNSTACYGNARPFSFGSGASAVNVRVTGWSLNSAMSSINKSWLGMWDAGFGVTSDGDSNGASNLHALDNKGRYDFIVLQFDKVVELTSVYLTPYKITGLNYVDTDATIGFGKTAIGYNSAPFTGSSNIPVSQLDSLIPTANRSSYNTTLNSARSISLSGNTGNVWIIGARFGTNDGEYDDFKVDQIKFNLPPPAVPEPSTWALMLLGFGAVGTMIRRRGAKGLAPLAA